MEENKSLTQELSKIEIKRKYLHVASIIIPFTYYFLSFTAFLGVFGTAFVLWLLIDLQRQKKPELQMVVNKFLGDLFRDSEAKTLSGATYLGIGMLLTAILFSKQTAIMAMAILAICDSVASLIGLKYGQLRIENKTLEGAAGFFMSGLLVVCIMVWLFNFKGIFLWENIVALAITTIAELYAKKLKLNDNILIPLVFSITVSLLETTV